MTASTGEGWFWERFFWIFFAGNPSKVKVCVGIESSFSEMQWLCLIFVSFECCSDCGVFYLPINFNYCFPQAPPGDFQEENCSDLGGFAGSVSPAIRSGLWFNPFSTLPVSTYIFHLIVSIWSSAVLQETKLLDHYPVMRHWFVLYKEWMDLALFKMATPLCIWSCKWEKTFSLCELLAEISPDHNFNYYFLVICCLQHPYKWDLDFPRGFWLMVFLV